MPTPTSLPPWRLLKIQAIACAAFLLLLSSIVGALYFQSRQREWILRQTQANHRLDFAFELISREVERVQADALFLADQLAVKEFASGNTSLRPELTNEYINFAKRKGIYDQIRLLDLNGQERIRVNYSSELAKFVEATELQNKSDRYYFQKSTSVEADDVYVSEFDLNLEHGEIELPLKPVIRFVAPVIVEGNRVDAYLVLNYLGAELLDKIDDRRQPGVTMLLRTDGHYLRGADTEDAWGWLLGHQNTFATRFPKAWKLIDEQDKCRLTANGAFAAKRISLGNTAVAIVDRNETEERLASRTTQEVDQDAIFIVSYLPSANVFAASNELLQRLAILAGGVFALVAVFVWPWARAVLTRQLQSRRIAESEEQLRELSSRLLQIQEDERRAISREIHDDLGQQVTAINLDLKLAERNCTSDAARPHLHRAISENESLLQTLHEFAKRVRPAVLDDLGLPDAIQSHLSEFQQRTGIAVESQLQFRSNEIPDNIADNTYRLLQESLTNVTKHAHATKVWVNMVLEHSPKKQFVITVRDDGRGNADPSEGNRLGLVGMRERVGLLFGEFQITADNGKGTCVEIRIPIPDQTGSAPLNLNRISVVLADDHAMVRQSLARVLEDSGRVTVTGQASDGRELLDVVCRESPECVVLDYSMPKLDAPHAIEKLLAKHPQLKILVLTVHENAHYAVRALNAGAHGYMIKSAAVDELVEAIDAVSRGDVYISPKVSQEVWAQLRRPKRDREGLESLSRREFDALRILGSGASLQECAETMHVTTSTVSTYRSRILEKLNLTTTAELIRFALENEVK